MNRPASPGRSTRHHRPPPSDDEDDSDDELHRPGSSGSDASSNVTTVSAAPISVPDAEPQLDHIGNHGKPRVRTNPAPPSMTVFFKSHLQYLTHHRTCSLNLRCRQLERRLVTVMHWATAHLATRESSGGLEGG